MYFLPLTTQYWGVSKDQSLLLSIWTSYESLAAVIGHKTNVLKAN